jgi:arylsulfatase A-like enzyme
MFVNYTEPHLEYDPPESYWEKHLPGDVSPDEAKRVPQNPWKYIAGCSKMSEREFDVLRALYKAELRYLDSRIGRLYDHFGRKGLLDSTWIIVCSDHGENIGDHDLMDHQYCLYDTLLRVPLIVRPPGGLAESRTVSNLVELRDLFPTVLDVAGLSLSSGPTVTQNSLVPAVSESEQVAVGREFTVSEHPIPNLETLYDLPGADVDRVVHYERAIRCIRTNRFKFIERTDETEALFDLQSDPSETDDLSQRRPELVTRLRELLYEECGDAILEEVAAERSDDLSATTQKHLRDLGYVDV